MYPTTMWWPRNNADLRPSPADLSCAARRSTRPAPLVRRCASPHDLLLQPTSRTEPTLMHLIQRELLVEAQLFLHDGDVEGWWRPIIMDVSRFVQVEVVAEGAAALPGSWSTTTTKPWSFTSEQRPDVILACSHTLLVGFFWLPFVAKTRPKHMSYVKFSADQQYMWTIWWRSLHAAANSDLAGHVSNLVCICCLPNVQADK